MNTAKIICANDATKAVVLQKENEAAEDFETRTKEILEVKAKEAFEQNKHAFEAEPALGRSAYQVYRHQVYWHIHDCPIIQTP